MGNLHLIVGRSGCGKTDDMLGRLCQRTAECPQILLTPDQISHEMERRLCKIGGDSISLSAQVLTFSRLSNQVFFHCGGSEDPELDGGGRVLVLYRSVQAAKDRLKILGKFAQYPSFYEKLLKTVDELKACCVLPEDLTKLETDSPQYDKIQEISLICGLYDGFTQQIAFDPRDRFTRMAEKLRNSDWGEGKEFWLDGFTDFTQQQIEILRPLLKQGVKMTVVLTGEMADNAIFHPTHQTVHQLKRLAEKEGISVTIEELETPSTPCRPGVLGYLEANLFQAEGEEEALPYPEDCGEELTLFSALTPRSEVEWTASEIRRLVQEKGYRYRDITVVARDFAPYRHLIPTLFPRYGVPVFTTQMSNILEKPVLSVVTSALTAITRGYRYEELFRYLKSGFSQLELDELDLLENYVLLWQIRGGQWRDLWTKNPRGFGAEDTPSTEKRLAELNLLREKVILPLEHLWDKSQGVTAQEQCKFLYDFLEEIKLYDQIKHRSDRWFDQGDRAQGEEYLQLWDILCGGLEQCHQLFPEAEMSLEEFGKTFGLVLSQYNVGTIPVSLDQVVAGETVRLKNHRSAVVFWLGTDDSSLPLVTESGGLFNDDDRVALEGADIALNQRSDELLFREMTTMYEITALPREKLYLTWPSYKSGQGVRPSFLVERMVLLCPEARQIQEEDLQGEFRLVAPEPALEQGERFPLVKEALRGMPGWGERVALLEATRTWSRGRLEPNGVEAVFGREIPMSATKIEKIKSCHFQYFMEYGLKAKAREQALFSAREYGTFVHHVLEQVMLAWKAHWDKTGASMGNKEVETLIDGVISTFRGDFFPKETSPRMDYLFGRMGRGVKAMAVNALEELEASQFTPHALELGFRKQQGDLPPIRWEAYDKVLEIAGVIDRVDAWLHGDTLYLRLVDYKTGKKGLELSDVFRGRNLQLLIYLFALQAQGRDYFLDQLKDKVEVEEDFQLKAAAVSYFPAREVVIQGSNTMTPKAWQKELDKKLERSGISLYDETVLDALEKVGTDGYRFLPLTVRSSGATVGKGLLTPLQMEDLESHVQEMLSSVCFELGEGNINADPYWQGEDNNVCQYCDYVTACHFEEGRGGDCRRYIRTMGEKEVLDCLQNAYRTKEEDSTREGEEESAHGPKKDATPPTQEG